MNERKYYFYEDYKEEVTKGFEWLLDLGNADLYFNKDEQLVRKVYKESAIFWQSDKANIREWFILEKEIPWLFDMVNEIKQKEDEDIDTTDDIFYLEEQLHFR